MNRYFVCFASLLLMCGCGASSKQERHWTEEVLLDDGSTVQIERYVAFNATNAMGGGAGNAVESKSTLQFTGKHASLPAWDFPRIALVLYRSKETGNWVVVSTSSSCQVWRREGKPRPPYWQHEILDEQWGEVPVSDESIGKKTNLFYSYWKNDFPERVSPAFIKSRQSDPRTVEKYRHVARDPRDFNCME